MRLIMKIHFNSITVNSIPSTHVRLAGRVKTIIREAKAEKLLLGCVLLIAPISGHVLAADRTGNYVAHEWGTFTSVQADDGVLLEWQPLENSPLPKFIYDWAHPGPGRLFAIGKG